MISQFKAYKVHGQVLQMSKALAKTSLKRQTSY